VTIVNPVVSFLLIILIARYREVSFLGNYSLILAFLNIFSMISCLGIETLIVRDVSKDVSKANKYVINGFVLMFLSGISCALIMSFLAIIFRYTEEVRIAFYVASFILIPSSLSAVFRGVFKAFQKNFYITLAAIIENIFRVGISVAILYCGLGLSGLMTASLTAALLGFLIAVYLIRNKLPTTTKFEMDSGFCRRIVKTSITFALISIVVSFYWQIGIIILSKIEGPSAVGIFSAASRLFNMILGFIVAFGVSVFPIISKKYEILSAEFERVSVNSARYLVIFVLFLAIVTTFLSEDIIQFLYGIKFKESAEVLRVLLWATVPFSMVTVFAYSLFSSYNQKADLAINFVGLASNVFLNLLLVPRLSYLGTSLAMFGSTTILLICQYVFINYKLFRLKLAKILASPILCSLLTVIFIIMLRSKINLYLLIAASTFLYFFALYFLKGFDESEKAYLKNLSLSVLQFSGLNPLRR